MVPITIKPAPIAVFRVSSSFKKIIENTTTSAILNLSTAATCETFPIYLQGFEIENPRKSSCNAGNH